MTLALGDALAVALMKRRGFTPDDYRLLHPGGSLGRRLVRVADIMHAGITLSGGGALLAGLDRRLAHETGMPINIAPDPLYAVVLGSGQALENIEAMRGLLTQTGID